MPKDFNNLEEDVHQKTRKVRRMPTSTDPETASVLHEQDDNASTGTTASHDVIDHVSEGHPVPVTLIEDHFAELAQGINPATCLKCGAPMELHAQFEPTMQHYEENDAPISLSAHLAAEHDVPDVGELDPIEDGLIIDRLQAIHVAKHAAIQNTFKDTRTFEQKQHDDKKSADDKETEKHNAAEPLKKIVHNEPPGLSKIPGGNHNTPPLKGSHGAVSDGNGGTLEAPDPNKPAFQMMPEMLTNIQADKCPTCKNPVFAFRDDLSKKEYGISGMCQGCQDSVFGGPSEGQHDYLHEELKRLEDAGNATTKHEELQPIAIRYHNLADHIQNVTGTDPRPTE